MDRLEARMEKFNKLCRSFDPPTEPLPASEPIPKPRYDSVTVTPRSGLFDIYKRTTNLSENKCVGIGFTYKDAEEFINTRLKPKCNLQDTYVTFYEIVEQGNKDAIDPLWNPPVFTKEDTTIEIGKYAN